MDFDAGRFLLVGAILLFISVLAGKFSNRFGTPTLLFFLLLGMLFGSDGLGVEFYSPDWAQFIGMMALSIILFSGGMDTKRDEIKPIAAQGIVLASVGVLLTALVTGAFIFFVSQWCTINLTFTESLLLAAIMSSTDSASVFSILRSKKMALKENLRPLLELESGSNDPMAYVLTILLISVLQAGDVGWGQSLLLFFVQMGVGALSGYLLGKLAVFIINRIDIGNKSLYSVLLLAFVLFIFAFTDFIKGNGFLAVYIAGLIVGNNKLIYKKSLASFFDGLTWLFQIIMFLTLGLLVNPHELLGVTLIGLIVGIFMILFARPISVLLCLAPFRQLSTRARLYVSWVGLRGAVPIIFATYPIVAQLEHARIIFNIVFFITILSLVIQGTTVSWVASLLGLSTETKERGFDIDLPDEVKAKLIEMEVTSTFMAETTLLRNVQLPPDVLVMMIRRGDEYLVPRGDTEIHLGDKLLFIRQEK